MILLMLWLELTATSVYRYKRVLFRP